MKPIKLGLLGLGTVGFGAFQVLARNQAEIQRRAGRGIEITKVAVRNVERARGLVNGACEVTGDPFDVVNDPDIDVVVETIGGYELTRELVLKAIENGKHVVTANKALLAVYGNEIFAAARAARVMVAFEAAVAGGIPIIKALREGLAGNKLSQVTGILNGTCNYILTTMRETGRDFADVLAEAQALGYAEADPSFDIDGIDAAHKLAILASVAFGTKVDFAKLYIEGIRHISALDIQFAQELGYRIKLLGIARKTEAGIEQRVHPCMVPINSSIGRVDGVFNAVVAEGDYVGRAMFEGRGAGAGPTASAVAADIVDIAAGRRTPTFGIPAEALQPVKAAPMEDRRGAYYIRLMVLDKPGVFADIAAALRDEEVSMEAVLQRARSPDESVPVVLTVHDTREASMSRAIARIAANPAVVEPPHLIRIETV